ncbi:MAG: aspartate carbamoyltransferase [Methanothrix sp.]|nr:aspartate carbamoyltransferase [Methanothrix sp.]
MFKKRHVLSMRDFSREEIDFVLDMALSLEPYARGKKSNMLEGKILALLFFEPSTRTRMSFETAMKRPARLASEFSPVPVLNAGDGAGHHPTQTLLDLYTIKKEQKHIDNLSIALVGDLKYGRTVHSLAYALSLYGAEITLVSPPSLRMPEPIRSDLSGKETRVRETSDLSEVIDNVDVLYMTRIQRERFPDPQEYSKVARCYRLTPDSLSSARKNLIIMHPLPRVDEISPAVDETPYARYFQQSFYGVTIRMALLKILIGGGA